MDRMPGYFAHISHNGPIRYEDVPGSIGVLEAHVKPMPDRRTILPRPWRERAGSVDPPDRQARDPRAMGHRRSGVSPRLSKIVQAVRVIAGSSRPKWHRPTLRSGW